MAKRILLIACFLIFSRCAVTEKVEGDKGEGKADKQMEVLVDNISDLASKVLDIFEPIATKASNASNEEPDNTYFVSFLLRSRKNKTEKVDDQPRQRMVVNNNFSGQKMGTNQVYLESGPSAKQPPSHNIQLLNRPQPQEQQQQQQQQSFPSGLQQPNYG